MMSQTERKTKLQRLSRASGLIVVLAGASTLLGWALDIRILKSALPGLVEMKPNTAACFVLAGLSLLGDRGARARRLANGFTAITVLIGLATIVEYTTGWNPGLDELLFKDYHSLERGLPPGRMALSTAIAFVLMGFARIVSARGNRPVLAQGIVFFTTLFPLLSFLAYVFGERAITLWSPYSSLAITTVFAFFALGAGILCECSDAGPMAVFVADDPGGVTLRTLLPVSVVATLSLGLLGFVGARAGLYSHASGMVIFAVITAVALTAAIWANALFLSRAEALRVREGEWFRSTLSSINDAVIATDGRGCVLFMNRVAEAMTGWGSREAAGSPLGEIIRIVHESARVPTNDPIESVLATGDLGGPVNPTILIARDGTERPIEQSAAPIKDGLGAISGMVLVFRDVAEKKQAEREREGLVKKLKEEEQRKDEFLAMLAHELRNPLSAIGNAVQLASMSRLRSQVDWSMEIIGRQIKHLGRLIDDLLDVSRISRGKIELRKQVVDVAPLLDHAVDTVRGLIEQREQSIEAKIERGTLWVSADPTRIEQVVVNLLNNAAKYSENRSLIRLSADRDAEEVVISVEDHGAGIQPERIARMFDLFAQEDRSLARSEGGLGIGLTVVKKLVEMHEGSVTARSEGPGMGSEFVIRLPAARTPADQPASSREPAASSSKKARVLVVDDNVDTARGMARLLKLIGHDVITAHAGPEAIEAACRHRPEFVLLDIGLPGMDGYEVASRLRREDGCKSATIIAVTGYGQDEDRRRSKEAGFDYHFLKPVNHDALLALLSKLAATTA